jgi:hypothetical protein
MEVIVEVEEEEEEEEDEEETTDFSITKWATYIFS